ncbi:hypothetical protein C4D60_Mb07t05230 [Musa balbisiana]|uniref:Peroxidase n=1 Tax=Musa balbisiana TaxID=52838 RepID=A0A4S8JEA5_MUSBA|nr:hypothetical protein C4D60_Mb07t05230 [Musa balbisiana]
MASLRPSPCALLFLFFVAMASAQLSPTFYNTSCPDVLSTIQSVVAAAVANESRMGASLLRLHFHDCFVNATRHEWELICEEANDLDDDDTQGCDGSVLLDDTANFTGEKNAFPNKNSIRGFDVVDSIKSQVEAICVQVVSCADILAVAARDSVVALGGPSYTVQLGRRDATTASLSAANSNLPPPTLSLSGLLSSFSSKGLSSIDMVALSGAHTIGSAKCSSFRNRIYNEANIDASFANSTQANCPSSGGDDNLSPLDVVTPTVFDNSYFQNLVSEKGLLHSDQQLYNGGSTDSLVTTYSEDTDTFFSDFATAMVNMGNISPLTGTDGEIRLNCRKIN